MTTDRLYCKCGIEVRVVRLGQSLLTLGHLQNPKHKHHRVRLARAAAGRSSLAAPDSTSGRIEGNQRQPKVPDQSRGTEAPDGREEASLLSPADPATSIPVEVNLRRSSSAGKGVDPVVAPRRGRSALARSAGSITAGGTAE